MAPELVIRAAAVVAAGPGFAVEPYVRLVGDEDVLDERTPYDAGSFAFPREDRG